MTESPTCETSKACVFVRPPLSANGPIRGLMGTTLLPTKSPLAPFTNPTAPAAFPIKLWPCYWNVPETSGSPVVAVLVAINVLITLMVPEGPRATPPPRLPALFSSMVTCRRLSVPVWC